VGLGVTGQQRALPSVPAEWAAPAFIQPRGAAGSREHGCLVTQAVDVEPGRPPILLHLAEPLIRDPLDVLVVFVVCVAFGQLAGEFRIAPVVDAASVGEVLELDHLGVSQSATHAAYRVLDRSHGRCPHFSVVWSARTARPRSAMLFTVGADSPILFDRIAFPPRPMASMARAKATCRLTVAA